MISNADPIVPCNKQSNSRSTKRQKVIPSFATAAQVLEQQQEVIDIKNGKNDTHDSRSSTNINQHNYSRSSSIGGFQSAATYMKTITEDKVDTDKPRHHVEEEQEYHPKQQVSVSDDKENQPAAPAVANSRTITLNLKVKGVNHYLGWNDLIDKLSFQNSKPFNNYTIELEREPENEHDDCAIQVLIVSSSHHDDGDTSGDVSAGGGGGAGELTLGRTKVGYVAKEQAAILAPLLDQSCIVLEGDKKIEVSRCFQTTLSLNVQFTTTAMLSVEPKVLLLESQLGNQINVEYAHDNWNFAGRDLKQSYSSPYLLPPPTAAEDSSVRLLRWNPCTRTPPPRRERLATGGSRTTSPDKLELKFGWPISNNTATISSEERKQQLSWPPSDDILSKLGLGGSNDAQWWNDLGCKPPSEWLVHGAYDLIGGAGLSSKNAPVKLQSNTQLQYTNDLLNGAIHGATNVFTDDTLESIRSLMHSENFWLTRKGESFIRAYGGPYVLGQTEQDLHLVVGGQHNSLTSQICRIHNLVYTTVHLEYPVSPGFNTLIFGMNLLAAGFHYHQDAIGELAGKNAPLLPKQPVVTTVFYEKPTQDSGKECVFWKPMLNFQPRASTSATDFDEPSEKLYLAARALPTQHGQIHIQRAGLQSVAQHGIFHTPQSSGNKNIHNNTIIAIDVNSEENDDCREELQQQLVQNDPLLGARKGYRVAITARITYPNSLERVSPHLPLYKGILGPEGNLTMPSSIG